MSGRRKNRDRAPPTSPYSGRPNNPQVTPIGTGTPTFVVSGLPPTTTVGPGGIPLDMDSIERGLVPIFWGNNQFMRQSDQRYVPPSGMTSNSTLSIPEVVRFIYSGLPAPGSCSPPVPPPPPPCTGSGQIIITSPVITPSGGIPYVPVLFVIQGLLSFPWMEFTGSGNVTTYTTTGIEPVGPCQMVISVSSINPTTQVIAPGGSVFEGHLCQAAAGIASASMPAGNVTISVTLTGSFAACCGSCGGA
jgi:hypothetical protein